jgi:hypothetical protein
MFFIDTTPLMEGYYQEGWAANKGGLFQQSWQEMVLEFEADLARSTGVGGGWAQLFIGPFATSAYQACCHRIHLKASAPDLYGVFDMQLHGSL